jgi:hypothetical protein
MKLQKIRTVCDKKNSRVSDPYSFDTDPDPTFLAESDPDPGFF